MTPSSTPMRASASTGLAVPVVPLAEAVRRHVADGARVYLGNFGAQLFAVGHEMVRQGRRDLDLIMASGGILLDQLLGARVARSATFAHCWSPVGPGPAWCLRRLSEGGDDSVRLRELSLGHLTAALTAGAWGVPFMPVPDLPETGYVREDWSDGRLELVETAIGAARVVQAIAVDVAFVHVDVVDGHGNATVRGPLGEALAAAQAATTVVAVAEEVVAAGALPRECVRLPGLLVDVVVHHPGAVRPDGAAFRYARDVTAYEAYVRAASTEDGFAAWLAEVVFS